MKLFRRLTGSAGFGLSAALVLVVTSAGCSAGAIDAVELAPGALFEGLVAHWTFDDGAGLTLTDVAGSHHDGTLLTLTGTTWIPGQSGFGGALRFDGSDQSEVQVPATFPQPTASWSVAGWIRAPNISTADLYATIISTEIPVSPTTNAGGWELNMRIGTPTNPDKAQSLYQYAYSQGTGASNYTFAECDCFVSDTWVHVAGVFDADKKTISIYQNGIFASRKSAETLILMGSDVLYFGRWGFDSTRRLTGDLDDFVIYNRALTQPEIKQLARGPLPTTPPP